MTLVSSTPQTSPPKEETVHVMTRKVGSLMYMAPEVFNGLPYNHKVKATTGVAMWCDQDTGQFEPEFIHPRHLDLPPSMLSTPQADVFSLAVVMYELLHRKSIQQSLLENRRLRGASKDEKMAAVYEYTKVGALLKICAD